MTPGERAGGTLRRLATAPIRVYQRVISPAFPNRCKYHPSCSEYAVQAVRRYGVMRGAVLAVWRLLRCNPWSHGGVDFVEDQKLPFGEFVVLKLRMDVYLEVTPFQIHVQRAILVPVAENTITVGGSTELFHLFFEGVDLFLGFL